MLKREDRHAQVGEDGGLGQEGHSAESVLHVNLRHERQVLMGVVRHDDAGEENRRDARQVQRLGTAVGEVGADEHHAELERRIATQVDVFQNQRTQ